MQAFLTQSCEVGDDLPHPSPGRCTTKTATFKNHSMKLFVYQTPLNRHCPQFSCTSMTRNSTMLKGVAPRVFFCYTITTLSARAAWKHHARSSKESTPTNRQNSAHKAHGRVPLNVLGISLRTKAFIRQRPILRIFTIDTQNGTQELDSEEGQSIYLVTDAHMRNIAYYQREFTVENRAKRRRGCDKTYSIWACVSR